MSLPALAGIVLVGLAAGVVLLLTLAVVALRLAQRSSAPMRGRNGPADATLLSVALQDAVRRLKAQERAAEARAVTSERFASRVTESLTAGLIVVERGGLIRTVNPSARRMLALADGMAQAPYREGLSMAPALADVIGEVFSTGTPVARRTVKVSAGGGLTHLGVTVSPIPDDAGGLHAAVCLFTDLTTEIELEEQLRLKDALSGLGALTAGLAHEFRNGLATIHGYGRLLDPSTLTPPQAACVEGIRAETTALGEVVTNFLRFARPDPLTLAPVDLAAVVRRAVDDLPEGPHDITVGGSYGTVEGDDVLLRQAFSNLLRNSLEACASAGIGARVAVHGMVQGNELVVTVEDNGPGLDEAIRGRLFQPFISTKASGTGLGLAVVQKIVVSHNGRSGAIAESATNQSAHGYQASESPPFGRVVARVDDRPSSCTGGRHGCPPASR